MRRVRWMLESIATMTGRQRATFLADICVAFAVAGCASSGPPTEQATDYLSRVNTLEDGQLRVSVAALSAEEGAAAYGVELAEKGLQAVWVEVENRAERAYWLLPAGLDPNYFPASEAAEAFERGGSKEGDELARRFQSLAFQNPAPPGKTSGFLLVNLDEGVKLVHIDLVATGDARSFSFLVTVPGFRADYAANDVFRREIDAAGDAVDYTDAAAFRAALESLPCCVSNEKGSKTGDPVNLVIVGGLDDAFPALVRRGWRPTEATWSGSVLKMMTSALKHDRYPYAPVSNLYLYGRRQDLALQKARDTIHQRNHLRLWLSPMRYEGKQVWVGQISRDIGSRLTIHSKTLTTHKIDPDVDEARRALLEDTAYSQALARFGFVAGVGEAPASAPRRNLTNDPWYTDGRRVVLVFDKHPSALTDIELLPWEVIPGQLTEPVAAGEGP
jgi:hypothetical protein